jgi:signal transduction histidine kinase
MKVSMRQKQGATRHKGVGAKGDNSAFPRQLPLPSSRFRVEHMAVCFCLVNQSLTEVRTMSYLLYPPMLEEIGLRAAVPGYLEGFTKRDGIQRSLDISQSCERMLRDAELAIFRILHESLTNVHRHSGSRPADIRIRCEDGMATLEVKDNGAGIPACLLEPAKDSLGTLSVDLRGMNERVKQLGETSELRSTPAGTHVAATIPWWRVRRHCGTGAPAPYSVYIISSAPRTTSSVGHVFWKTCCQVV